MADKPGRRTSRCDTITTQDDLPGPESDGPYVMFVNQTQYGIGKFLRTDVLSARPDLKRFTSIRFHMARKRHPSDSGGEVVLALLDAIDLDPPLSVFCSDIHLEVVTVVVNWLIKPLTMTALAWLFIRCLFGAWIQAEVGDQYIAGMILLGVAPCTAMVFVWSRLCDGDANYTLAQVAINDLIMVFAFAPIAALLLGVSKVLVPWDTLVTAVGLFVVVPLVAGWLTRLLLRSPGRIERLERRLKPLAIVSLIATVLLLFMVQARAILANPLAIALIAIPLILQTYLIFWISAQWMRLWRQPQNIAAPGAMIGASNFFELAVAVAISLFGLNSGAALATVVGVLVEVPVMLSLVAIANRNQRLFPYRPG